jgi:hypothetical protein
MRAFQAAIELIGLGLCPVAAAAATRTPTSRRASLGPFIPIDTHLRVTD